MTLVQFTVTIPKDNELTDFRYLKGLEKEIESFYKRYRSPYDQYLLNFLRFYEDEVKERRKKRKDEVFKERDIREEKEIEKRTLFMKTHKKTDENVKKEKEEHESRWLIEEKIRKEEWEKEKQCRQKEDENIKKIKKEIEDQKKRLLNQRISQYEWEQSSLKRMMKEQEEEEYCRRRQEICDKYGDINTKIGKKCDICLNDIGLNKTMIFYVCSHRFHVDCILKWDENHEGCPACRKIKENK